ncbi:MAG: PilZ domain-containing protein [Treponema sp.]|nr:PilZ domain-containing protein [Treponema sp.]
MAVAIKRIEKDFLLKVLYDEQIPVLYLRDRTQFVLTLDRPAKADIVFHPNAPIDKLKPRSKMELMFDYRGQVIMFTAEVSGVKDDLIFCGAPEFLYKNLDRAFSRVDNPPDVHIHFTFMGDRYNLSFPKITEFETGETENFFRDLDPNNLSGLVDQMAAWIKGYANGYKLLVFKDVKPAAAEEKIVAETGKTLFLPSSVGGFPQTDPYPKKRIVTENMFKRYLESTGIEQDTIDSTYTRFIKEKFDAGISSDAWIPILFQEYIIGYIHIWLNRDSHKPPFDYSVIDTLHQFAKVLAYSLKINGYFESGKMKNDPFEGKVIDISASGVLFAYPHSSLSTTLLVDSELSVKIVTPRRNISSNAKIIRRYKDNSLGYFGCKFLDMAPEDLRFLFEFLYGKPFADSDASFLTGQV